MMKNEKKTKNDFMTDAVELTRQLVQIESTDPGCYETDIEKFINNWLKERISALPKEFADQITIKELEALPERKEIMASISGTEETLPRLVFICHMDTVVIGEDWDEEIDPLGAQVRDDRIYGRGSCDMKSGLACAMSAFARVLKQTEERGELPKRAVSIIVTVDEEADMRGVEAAIKAGWVGAKDWVMDCEPTDNMLQIAHKGRTWFELTIKGITAHASQPEHGADAIAAMAIAIQHIRNKMLAQPIHKELGKSTVTFGQIEGGYQPYVVPDHCKVWIDMRLVPPCNTKIAEGFVREAIAVAQKQIPGIKGSYIITGDRPPVERDPKSPLAAAIINAAKVAGYPTEVSIFTGYTDTAVIAGKCGNHNCMSYGPGSLALAHKPNEYVAVRDVIRVEKVLQTLTDSLLWR